MLFVLLICFFLVFSQISPPNSGLTPCLALILSVQSTKLHNVQVRQTGGKIKYHKLLVLLVSINLFRNDKPFVEFVILSYVP